MITKKYITTQVVSIAETGTEINSQTTELIPADSIGGGINKTIIPVTTDFIIDWQNAIVPNDTRTYAQKHGNNIGNIEGVYLADDGLTTGYKPLYSYSLTTEGLIQTLNLNGIFAGTITII